MKKLFLTFIFIFTMAFAATAQISVNIKGGADWLFKNYEFYEHDFPKVYDYSEETRPCFDFLGLDALLQMNGGIEQPVGFVLGVGIGYAKPALAEWITAGLVFNIETNYLLIQPNILFDIGMSETFSATYLFTMAEANISFSLTDGPAVVLLVGVNYKSHFDTQRFMMMPWALEVGLGYRFDD